MLQSIDRQQQLKSSALSEIETKNCREGEIQKQTVKNKQKKPPDI
jgi:hypothetical protein